MTNNLERFTPTPINAPESKSRHPYKDPYIPESFNNALKIYQKLLKSGFELRKAGVSVITSPKKAALAYGILNKILDANMMTTVDHFLLSLKPTAKKDVYPSYYARTITSPKDERISKKENIIKEYISPVTVEFLEGNPPECSFGVYPENHENASQLFLKEISTRLGLRKSEEINLDNLNIAILAGIGRNSNQIATELIGGSPQIADVKHGSTILDLARIAIALYDWGLKSPKQSLFIVSTTRLTNDHGKVPQAYILNKLFKNLGLDPKWLGICIGRVGETRGNTTSVDYRKYPTGAVLVEIKPKDYRAALNKIKELFNKKVQEMIYDSMNDGLFNK